MARTRVSHPGHEIEGVGGRKRWLSRAFCFQPPSLSLESPANQPLIEGRGAECGALGDDVMALARHLATLSSAQREAIALLIGASAGRHPV